MFSRPEAKLTALDCVTPVGRKGYRVSKFAFLIRVIRAIRGKEY